MFGSNIVKRQQLAGGDFIDFSRAQVIACGKNAVPVADDPDAGRKANAFFAKPKPMP